LNLALGFEAAAMAAPAISAAIYYRELAQAEVAREEEEESANDDNAQPATESNRKSNDCQFPDC
jgi:hypothetical protein